MSPEVEEFIKVGGVVAALASTFFLFRAKMVAMFSDLKAVIMADHASEKELAEDNLRESKKTWRWIETEGRKYLAQLHDWHDVKGSDGVPIWYMGKQMEKLIERATQSMEKSSESNQQVAVLLRQIHEEMKRNNDAAEARIRRYDDGDVR